MTLLSAYLSKSKVKKILASKPGQEGFSLIELVVVVAVLAVLSAIAIPQFTNISNKARTAAAMNTVATVAKECAAKIADQGVGGASQYRPPITMQGYNTTGGWHGDVTPGTNGVPPTTLGAKSTSSGLINCPNSKMIGLVSDTPTEYPSFFYGITDGQKACAFTAGSPAQNRGCSCSGTPAICSW
tara:strand:- start:2264 stop:2818 length:555 start_codon:yes stop_codon:yes gene_type:complete